MPPEVADQPSVSASSSPAGRPEVSLEVERKYAVHGLFRLPELPGATHRGTVELSATYYDTEDLRLARHSITLRRREGGTDAGWHLKLPTELGVGHREELALPLSAGPLRSAHTAAPPSALAELVLGRTRGATLAPVAELRTERTVVELRDPVGRLLAELTDDTVSVLDGERIAARFRELELETREGTEGELDEIAGLLLAAGAVAGEFTSKAARALGPGARAAGDVPAPGEVGPRDPAGAAVRAHVHRQVRAILDQDLRVRRDLPDAVHQMRVAARRLRSGLRVFAPLLEASWAGPLSTELQWIAQVLGEVRDREVLIARLESDLATLPYDDASSARPVVRRVLTSELADARAAMAEAMRSVRYLALLDSLVAAAREPALKPAADAPAEQALPPLVARAWKRLASHARTLTPETPDPEWHQTRIAAKKARYAAEACVPVLGRPARLLAVQLAIATEVLGEHQDAVVAAQTIRAMLDRPRVNARAGFALGLLHGVEQSRARQEQREFTRLWPEISRRRYRRWLTG